MSDNAYRSRLAPSPTGLLHLGHARTFWIAQQRSEARRGALVLRNEDLDKTRCRPEFAAAMIEDLHWFGLRWEEGPDCGGPFGPYAQSERQPFYATALQTLYASGLVYPCTCSRQDVQRALQAPHPGDEEPIYPGTCRRQTGSLASILANSPGGRGNNPIAAPSQSRVNWRFRVPDGETIAFADHEQGPQSFLAGRDFGDFVIWRHDGIPSYQLAVVVDDEAMRITEVVRGADLLISTARQILLYRALRLKQPAFFHCSLLTDERGIRLAKRHDALSLRALRENGATPESLRSSWPPCPGFSSSERGTESSAG